MLARTKKALPRWNKIYEMRESGASFVEIGRVFKVTPARAQNLYHKAIRARTKAWFDGLPPRTRTIALIELGCASRDDLMQAVLSGKLDPEKVSNFGVQSYNETMEWLGICPHCKRRIE